MTEANATARTNLPELTVTELSVALKRTVEDSFPFVRVRGEVSDLKLHSSGHLYFDLKDEKSCLNAVIWRTTVQRLRVRPEKGAEVVCTGRITTYAGSSRYQIVVDQVELAGLGALMAMLEARRKKLAQEGLFEAKHKRKLPFLPRVIGVVTSPTGAVIRDIMHRINARFPCPVLVWPVTVQGDRAAAEIAAAIEGFNGLAAAGTIPRPDLLIVARGGGSIEDLMPFNDEAVVRAVFAGTIPLISAVGHETDTTLIDFAADVRAPTPTAAAEMAVPVRSELMARAHDMERRLLRAFVKELESRRKTLSHVARLLPRGDQILSSTRQRVDQMAERLAQGLVRNLYAHRHRYIEKAAQLARTNLAQQLVHCREKTRAISRRLDNAERERLKQWNASIDSLSRLLVGVSYRSVLERGFALVLGSDRRVRRRAAELAPGERLTLTFADSTAGATAQGAPEKRKGGTKTPVHGQDTLL